MFAGTPRSRPEAFAVMADDKLTHIDPLLGQDRAGSRVQAFYQTLADFMKQSSPTGDVVVHVAPTTPTTPMHKRLVF